MEMKEEVIFECSECGSHVYEEDTICPACGADLGEKEHFHTINQFSGIKGWLLVLCIILLVILPLTSFIKIIAALDDRSFYDIDIMSEMRLYMIQNLIYWSSTGAFSLVAGLNLIRKKKGAAILAKIFFIFYFCLTILKLLLYYYSFYFMTEMFTSFIPNLLLAMAAFIYLLKSKRIKETFPS